MTVDDFKVAEAEGANYTETYLRQYYHAIPPCEDQLVVLPWLIQEAKRLNKSSLKSLAAIGAAGNINSELPFREIFREIHFFDILPSAIAELTNWKDNRSKMNYDLYAKYILENEEITPTNENILKAHNTLRSKMRVGYCDITKPGLGLVSPNSSEFSAVSMCYVLEQAIGGGDKSLLAPKYLSNISNVIEPGGHLFLVSLLDTPFWTLHDADETNKVSYSMPNFTESDIKDPLMDLGFDPNLSTFTTKDVSGQEYEGVGKLLLVHAIKSKK